MYGKIVNGLQDCITTLKKLVYRFGGMKKVCWLARREPLAWLVVIHDPLWQGFVKEGECADMQLLVVS